MGLSTKASDWIVTFKEAAAFLTLTVLRFKFFSKTADMSTIFIFAGPDIGPGIIVGGDMINSTPIQCLQAFSANDLNFKPGVVLGLGGGVVAGDGVLLITAKDLFANQRIPGMKLAVGIKVFTAIGIWSRP